ncbi:hypothetical protein PG990_010930 [Apiospora arundinis]
MQPLPELKQYPWGWREPRSVRLTPNRPTSRLNVWGRATSVAFHSPHDAGLLKHYRAGAEGRPDLASADGHAASRRVLYDTFVFEAKRTRSLMQPLYATHESDQTLQPTNNLPYHPINDGLTSYLTPKHGSLLCFPPSSWASSSQTATTTPKSRPSSPSTPYIRVPVVNGTATLLRVPPTSSNQRHAPNTAALLPALAPTPDPLDRLRVPDHHPRDPPPLPGRPDVRPRGGSGISRRPILEGKEKKKGRPSFHEYDQLPNPMNWS